MKNKVMKTAMQELIEDLQTVTSGNPFISTTINLIIEMAEEKLEKEKQQIFKAYCKAEDMSEFFEYEHRYGREYLTAETYYDETYGK